MKGLKKFDSQILMHPFTHKNDFSPVKQFQRYLLKEHSKHGVIDRGNERKRASKRKCIEIEYHLQDNADVAQKYVKMYCDTNQIPALPFCCPHPKTHGARGFSKHSNIHFGPKLGHCICATRRIPCACVRCASMWDEPWIYGITSKRQAC